MIFGAHLLGRNGRNAHPKCPCGLNWRRLDLSPLPMLALVTRCWGNGWNWVFQWAPLLLAPWRGLNIGTSSRGGTPNLGNIGDNSAHVWDVPAEEFFCGNRWCLMWSLEFAKYTDIKWAEGCKGNRFEIDNLYNLYVDADCMHCMRFSESKKGLRVLGAGQTDKYSNKRHIRSFHSGICSRLWKIVPASTMTSGIIFKISCVWRWSFSIAMFVCRGFSPSQAYFGLRDFVGLAGTTGTTLMNPYIKSMEQPHHGVYV